MKIKNPLKYSLKEYLIICYCVCTFLSSIFRFMNYSNILFLILCIAYIGKTGIVQKNALSILWILYILVYPILDAKFRGGVGIDLFTLLCYLVPLFLLASSSADAFETYNIWKYFVIGFGWFQIAWIFLGKVSLSLYQRLVWKLLGREAMFAFGFTTDKTVTAYILCSILGIYVIEYYMLENKSTRKGILSLGKILIIFLSLLMSNKRSFLIATIFSLLLIVLICEYYNGKKFLSMIFLFGILTGIMVVICVSVYNRNGATGLLGRMGQTIIGIQEGEDVSNMRSTWVVYMNEWSQGREWLGIGWETFKQMIRYTDYGYVPNGHNVYRQIMCEEGYIGLSIYIGLMVLTVIQGIELRLFLFRDIFKSCYEGE